MANQRNSNSGIPESGRSSRSGDLCLHRAHYHLDCPNKETLRFAPLTEQAPQSSIQVCSLELVRQICGNCATIELSLFGIMKFSFEYRPSASPLVDSVWRSYSIGGGSFISNAVSQWEMVVTKQKDDITLSVRGPETHASLAPIPEDAEFIGIVFRHGVFMPRFPKSKLVDHAIHLGEHIKNSFHFLGSAWEFPTFENVDTLSIGLHKQTSLLSIKLWMIHYVGEHKTCLSDLCRGDFCT